MSASLLAQVPLFATLPQHELERLAATLKRLEIAPQTVLMREGEPGDRLYLVLSGELEVVKALATPDERLLDMVGPGDYVGEMSLLNPDGLRTASVRARTLAQLLEMTRADLEALLRREPALVYHLARSLSKRLQEAHNTTIRDLHEKNRQLTEALQQLQAAQAQLIEKQALERELQVARQIQESMLPRTLPRFIGFDFGARMVPARAVGGDFFDFIPFSRDRLGIVIGDVSSKGVPAALFMALTRSLLRAKARRNRTPRETLARVNQYLLDMSDAEMFVTVLYGVLERKTGAFAYARAGHELPLLGDASGQVTEPAHGAGMPLGLFPDPAFDEQTVVLPPGGALLLYTDGVTDALDTHGELFGLERLRQTLSAGPGASGLALCQQVLEAVLTYQGTAPQYDDITLAAVRRSL